MSALKELRSLLVVSRPAAYLYNRALLRKTPMTPEFREAMIGLVCMPIGKERLASKQPKNFDSTTPEECSGWYHVAYSDVMDYFERTNTGLYAAWVATPVSQNDVFLVSPDQCKVG